MARRRIIRPGQPADPDTRGDVPAGAAHDRRFQISAAWSKLTDADRPGYFFNRRPTVRCSADDLPSFISPMPRMLPRTALNKDETAAHGSDSQEEPFILYEDDHGRLRLHTKLNGADVTMGVTATTKRNHPAPTVTDAKRPRPSAELILSLALISAGVFAALMFGTFREKLPPASPAHPNSRPTVTAPEPPALDAQLASQRLTPPAGTYFPSADGKPRPASDGLARSPDRDAEPTVPATPVPDPALTVDPYAGRVARALAGEALQSALEADRLATKDLNLRQLDKILPEPAAVPQSEKALPEFKR